MQGYILLAVEYLLAIGCGAFAFAQGGVGERLGSAWFAANMLVSAATYNMGAPLVHLVEDGVFALGLLPLAMIFVSYWIGLVTLTAAALFGLEAVYLLNEWPPDLTYAWVNNCLWSLPPLIFLSCGIVNMRRRQRAERALAVEALAPAR